MRVHGNVFKQPDISQDTVDDLANKFLIGVDIKDLPADQQDQARNFTRSIFVVQQKDVNVTVHFENNVAVESNASGGVINAVTSPTPLSPKKFYWSYQRKLKSDLYTEGRSTGHSTPIPNHGRGRL